MRSKPSAWSDRIPVADASVGVSVREPQSPKGVVVIHSATAVPQRIQAGFADHLVSHGFVVVTYAYRGAGGESGDARTHPTVRMRDWIAEDGPAVARWARETWPGLPQLAVGHSVGGHVLAIGEASRGCAGIVLVASHAGVTKKVEDRRERLRLSFVFNGPGSLLTRVLGAFPASRLGMGEDLPHDLLLDWARWTRKPGYFFDDPTMEAGRRASELTCPVLAIGFSDDPWATPGQIDAITERLVNAPVDRRTITPQEAGGPVGHLGFLRPAYERTVWAQITAWLDERCSDAAGGRA